MRIKLANMQSHYLVFILMFLLCWASIEMVHLIYDAKKNLVELHVTKRQDVQNQQ